jgi:hypothetical protein
MAVAIETEIYQGRLGLQEDYHAGFSPASKDEKTPIFSIVPVENIKVKQMDRPRYIRDFTEATEALDQASEFYTKARNEYIGLPFMEKVFSGIKSVFRTRYIELNIPLPFRSKKTLDNI